MSFLRIEFLEKDFSFLFIQILGNLTNCFIALINREFPQRKWTLKWKILWRSKQTEGKNLEAKKKKSPDELEWRLSSNKRQ